jgi:hypothetical protein
MHQKDGEWVNPLTVFLMHFFFMVYLIQDHPNPQAYEARHPDPLL